PSLEHLLCDALEAAMMVCVSIGSRPALAAVVNARNAKQATETKRLTPVTPFFLSCVALARSSFLGDYRGCIRWAREGEQAAARLASPFFPECSVFRGGFTS